MARKPLVLSERARRDLVSIIDFYTAEASFDVARSFSSALRAEFDHIGRVSRQRIAPLRPHSRRARCSLMAR